MAHPPDPMLVERTLRPEVERHLATCPRCRVHRKLLAAPSDAVRSTGPCTDPGADATEPGDAPSGTVLEDDGANTRWLVWDERIERCTVLVEPRGPADPESLRRAAAVLDRVSHPHLVRIHRVFDGPPVRYVRDRIQGPHLGQLDLPSDPRAVAWLAQCASALAVLHAEGIAHGALRPTAVRISPEGRVHVLDSGLLPGDPDADWDALAGLFAGVGPPASDLLGTPRGRGASLLAWLLALRDPGAGGGPRYQPRGLLGVGGMGEVMRVYDPVLERVVAQKVLSSALLASGEHIDRFLTEAHITAQLQHPGVVPVHDLEHLPNGAIAFTMKQIEGRTLGQVILEVHAASEGAWRASATGWSLRRLVEALRHVCDAIAYAHDQGIVHLDLKPGNIMLGEYGEVLVFDWGLARRLEADGTVTLERASGTQGFMSPEQSSRDAVVVGPPSDIYALGATLRMILDGRAPTEGAWSPVRRDAPRELASVVRRAMDPRPGARYGSAKELSRDLAAWQDERVVGAHDYTVLETVVRQARPHQAPIAVSMVAAVVLLALASLAWMRVDGEREKADGMLAQALVDRANLAWDARDPVRAEAYAAAAVGLAGRSDARGLLARLARGWRPRLGVRWTEGCDEIELLGSPPVVACATESGVRGLTEDGVAWSLPGAVRRVRPTSTGGWTALTNGAIVHADANGRSGPGLFEAEDAVDAVELADGTLAVAHGRKLEILGPSGVVASAELDVPIRSLSHCGGSRFVVAKESGGLELLDLARNAEPVVLHADRVTGEPRCAPDGRSLAVVSERQVQIWSLRPPEQRHILVGHLGEVRSLDWSPDSTMLATGSVDGTVRLWDTRTGVERGRLPGHADVTDVDFAPDGSVLVTSTRRALRSWEMPKEPSVGTFDAVVEVVSLRWAADGSLYTLDRLGRPEGFDPRTGLETLPIFLRVVDLDTDPDGSRVAVVNRHGDFQVLDLEENVFTVDVRRAHAGGGTAVAWRPASPFVASGGRAGDLRVWKVSEDREETAWALGLGAPVSSLDWSADGSVLAARTEEAVVLLAGDDGAELLRMPADVSEHAIGPRGTLLAIAWGKGGLSLGHHDGTGAPARFERLDVDGQVAGLDFAPDQPLLASVTREGLVQVFHTDDGRELARLFAHPGGATDVGFSRDGRALASAGSEGEIVLLDTMPFLEPATTLESKIAVRYGVSRSGTELEFR
ncbi:MAG: protein kinase [Myxococcota bacterium]